jgi:glycosyltransferase 2 family protein
VVLAETAGDKHPALDRYSKNRFYRGRVVQLLPVKRSLKRFLQTVLVLALTAFFLWLFLKNADWRSVKAIFAKASLGWLVPAVVANMLALIFRTMRWRTLLDPEDPPPFYATFFANTIGYMASSLLPVRASDLARSALLSRRTTHRFSGAFGTVMTERVLDLSSVLLLFVYFTLRRRGEMTSDPRTQQLFLYLVQPAAVVAALAVTGLAVFVASILLFGARARRIHAAVGRIVPSRFRGGWMHFFDTFVATLEITKHGPALRRILLLTVGVWFCLSTQVYLSAVALHMPVPFDATFFITGASTIGLAVPTPGGVGGMHKVCQFVLTRFYHFDINASVAAAVLFHLVGTIPVIITGLILFLREGVRWRDVSSSTDE